MDKPGEGEGESDDVMRVNIFCSHCQQMPMVRDAMRGAEEGGER
jgi:hypothetical protein